MKAMLVRAEKEKRSLESLALEKKHNEFVQDIIDPLPKKVVALEKIIAPEQTTYSYRYDYTRSNHLVYKDIIATHGSASLELTKQLERST